MALCPVARRFSWLKHHMPCLTGLKPGLMLRVCSVTSQETPDISTGLHANISLLHQRKSTSSLSYLGSKLAPIYMVLAGSPTSICTALASSAALKVPDIRGMAGLSSAEGTQKLSSLNSVVTTIEAAGSMLSYRSAAPPASCHPR
jgi:hypothetical protein